MRTGTIIETTLAPKAVGTYSQGIKVNNQYFFSGQIGINPETGKLADSFEEQIQQILNNIDGLLTATQLTRNNIIKTTIFLEDLENFNAVNAAYENFFTQPYPARSCVEVRRLPKDCKIEIEVIAAS